MISPPATHAARIATPSTSRIRSAVAAHDILMGSMSAEYLEGPLDVASLFDERPTSTSTDLEATKVACVRGYLRRADGGCWMKHVRLARDCHEQNLVIRLGIDGRIRFETCRPVVQGETLLAWFDREMADRFAIPHLTPANIQGFQSYVCQECGVTFTHPNPLKIHIAFLCSKRHQEPPVCQTTTTPLFRPWPSSSSSSTSTSTMQVFAGGVLRWPFRSPPPLTPLALAPPQLSPIPSTTTSGTVSNNLVPTKSTSAGHRCCFCGKSYSRKYGLKIHIRTHTGYKPLRCKVCARPFGDPSNLNKHVRLHAEGETPYRCDACGKVLVRRRDLERHIKSRHPQMPI